MYSYIDHLTPHGVRVILYLTPEKFLAGHLVSSETLKIEGTGHRWCSETLKIEGSLKCSHRCTCYFENQGGTGHRSLKLDLTMRLFSQGLRPDLGLALTRQSLFLFLE